MQNRQTLSLNQVVHLLLLTSFTICLVLLLTIAINYLNNFQMQILYEYFFMFSGTTWEKKQSNDKKIKGKAWNSLRNTLPDKDSFSEAYFQIAANQWHFKTTVACILDWVCLTVPPQSHLSYKSVALFCHGILHNFYHLLNILKFIKYLYFPWKFTCGILFWQCASLFEQSVSYCVILFYLCSNKS